MAEWLAVVVRINRTFMELKSFCLELQEQLVNGINRTFMELKSTREARSNNVTLYQSNLYGIEIFLVIILSITLYLYQSNLYGIEIPAPSLLPPWGRRVSIEPLWNWNRRGERALSSYHGVSIEPLWNWNTGFARAMARHGPCINRTFMELKCGISLVSDVQLRGINRTFVELK